MCNCICLGCRLGKQSFGVGLSHKQMLSSSLVASINEHGWVKLLSLLASKEDLIWMFSQCVAKHGGRKFLSFLASKLVGLDVVGVHLFMGVAYVALSHCML